MFVPQETKKANRKYKNLPIPPILLADYFKDPGLSIAHMYMQDGQLNTNTCTLLIQTRHFDRRCRLAKCIFERTKLRYFPKLYYSKAKNKPIPIL